MVKLLTRIEELEAENAKLRCRLDKNSHKPPSTDGLTKEPDLAQSEGKKRVVKLVTKARP